MSKKKLDKKTIRQLLSHIFEPTLGGDIVSLGLVDSISEKKGKWVIKFHSNNPFDPIASHIAKQIKQTLEERDVYSEVLLTGHTHAKEINEYIRR